jgi:hypothetical protein
VLRIFIALKNPSTWPGFEPATFGSTGQHTNHYITKATKLLIKSLNVFPANFLILIIYLFAPLGSRVKL